jgi:hypothetical protein
MAAMLLPGLDDASQDGVRKIAGIATDLADAATVGIYSAGDSATESDSGSDSSMIGDDSGSDSSMLGDDSVENVLENLRTDIQCLVDLGLRSQEPIRGGAMKEMLERCFKCNECAQVFKRNSDLKRHRRLHCDTKPYGCGYCEQRFSRKDVLRVR